MTEAHAAAAEDIRIDLAGLPADELVEWLETMLLIRRFEERAERLGSRGAIPGGIHSAAGQEAVAVGTMRALRSARSRRRHPPLAPHRARQGPRAAGGDGRAVRPRDRRRSAAAAARCTSADLEPRLPRRQRHRRRRRRHRDGRGAGLPAQGRRAWPSASSATAGSTSGRTWEAANLAVIWKLPLVIVCENNMYAVETRFDLVLGGGSAVRRAEGFGLAAVSVDGQDVARGLPRRARGRRARARRRRGELRRGAHLPLRGPQHGPDHHLPHRRRGRRLARCATRSTASPPRSWPRPASIGDGDIAELDRRASERVDEAVAFAEASPFPELDDRADQRHLAADRDPGSPDERDHDLRLGLPAGHGRRDGARRDDLRARHRPLRARRPLRPGQGPRRALRPRRACATRRSRRPRWWPPASARRMHGMRPVVDLNFADFAMGAMDEIVNQAAKMRYMFGAKVPLVIRGSSGVGLFAAQHTNSVESWFAATPGPRRGDAGDARRRRRAARAGAARRRSRDLPHAQAAVVGARRGRRCRSHPIPFGQAASPARATT